ncbi:Dabb family protein [Amycolatopsis rubida]|uniref:Dabb family protein n=1 Tax=Amycolatopsis rubida TaxID=112413 RepID=A0A1I5HTN2_9PSEU|nr:MULTISPECIES: Dabb family protein [Amycolatopsis]MYW90908.1 Dabb family protein [Amycolatopsis rubida]NEC55893.1 Dabb family protein [Amycolatopsis rubida]OAP26025.1 Stress responsive A/B Barrel Domain protein [Amycolatopsis sp. M39]SFO51509.1 Stress responsive A/B Barrel Domain [Amycolatopsis rubida]
MIYHSIRFTLKPEVTAGEKTATAAKMRELFDRIPAVKARVVGPDFGGKYELGAVLVIEDIEGYAEYMNHPAHLELDRVGLPLVERFMSSDITDDPDPEIGAKIAEVHRSRFANVPDIAELISGLAEYTGSAAPGRHAS